MSALHNMVQDPALIYYYLQKAIRVVGLRRALAGVVAAWVRLRTASHPVAGSAAAQQIATELTQSGFCLLPDKRLTAPQVQAVMQHLAGKPLIDYYDPERRYSLEDLPATATKAHYQPGDVLACRTLTDLANDPEVLAAVTMRLGAKPTIATVDAWWTFGENNEAGQIAHDDIYHRDVDDLRFVKLFLYLTDTDERNGAHRFILGSHQDSHCTQRGPISDEAVQRIYDPARFKTAAGSAGTVFMEETWGIHRGLLARQGRRLVFLVLYVLAAKTPHAAPLQRQRLPAGYDPYINRYLFI